MKGKFKGSSTKPLITKDEIQKRVKEIAQDITRDYEGKDLVCIGILNGSYMFFTDLTRNIDLDLETEFVRFSSYDNNIQSKEIKTMVNLKTSLSGKHVILIEDIIDTGNTFYKTDIVQKVLRDGAISCKVAALISKPSRRVHDINIDYLGFEIEDLYIYGYGLDTEELGRNLEDIWYIEN